MWEGVVRAKESGPRAAGGDEAETEGWLEASAGAPAGYAQGVAQAPTLGNFEALLLPSVTDSLHVPSRGVNVHSLLPPLPRALKIM